MPNENTKTRKRRSPEQIIADLQAKQEAAEEAARKKKAHLQAKIKATKAKVAEAERKRDTRRKIIAGALALEHMAHDEAHNQTMIRLITRYAKPEDKELFDEYFSSNTQVNGSTDDSPTDTHNVHSAPASQPEIKSSFMEKLTG